MRSNCHRPQGQGRTSSSVEQPAQDIEAATIARLYRKLAYRGMFQRLESVPGRSESGPSPRGLLGCCSGARLQRADLLGGDRAGARGHAPQLDIVSTFHLTVEINIVVHGRRHCRRASAASWQLAAVPAHGAPACWPLASSPAMQRPRQACAKPKAPKGFVDGSLARSHRQPRGLSRLGGKHLEKGVG